MHNRLPNLSAERHEFWAWPLDCALLGLFVVAGSLALLAWMHAQGRKDSRLAFEILARGERSLRDEFEAASKPEIRR